MWNTARVRKSRHSEGSRGGGRAAAHYAWTCVEEEQVTLYFRRACSAARCKGYSRHFPEEDLSQVLKSAEIRNGWKHLANSLLSNFLKQRPGVLSPLQKKPPNNCITELLDNSIKETPTVVEKHTVKYNVVLWLQTFFAYGVFIVAKPDNFISLGIYSMFVKWNGTFHHIFTGRENTFRL